MTAKEFVSKHYGSLSAGVFAIGLLAVLATYGSGFTALGGGTPTPEIAAQQAPPAATGPAPYVSPREMVPADEEAAKKATDETTEEDQDPLEKAIAEETAKAEARREEIREQINKDREAAGLPLLPPPAE